MSGGAGEAVLDCVPRERVRIGVSLGIPLDADGAAVLELLPGVVVGVDAGVVLAQAGLGGASSNPFSGHFDGEDAFLAGLVAHPERYIVRRNEGLIQVIRSSVTGGTNVPADRAALAVVGEKAW